MNRISSPLKLLCILTGMVFLAVLGTGCGSSSGGASNGSASLPVQNPVTPTSVLLSGRVELPSLFNLENLSISRALGSMDSMANPYSGFIVEASFQNSAGLRQVVTGTIDMASGTYVLKDLPLNTEIEVTIRKGKVVLKRLVEPLTTSNAESIRNVTVASTAEALLVEKIRAQGNTSGLVELRKLESFSQEVVSLSEVLNTEFLNENLDENAPSLIERPVVIKQAENSAGGVVGSAVPNQLPWLVFERIDTSQRANVRLQFTLNDREGDPADIFLTFSSGNQQNETMTQSAEEFLPLNGLVAGDGRLYSFVWASARDLGVGRMHDVRVTARVWPGGANRTEANQTETVTIRFQVDNRGLPNISSLAPVKKIVGQPLTLQILGDQFQNVERVYLEYLGNQGFIQPRSVEVPFTVFSPQEIQADLTAWKLFPVPYNIVVVDREGFQSVSVPVLNVEEDLLPQPSLNSLVPTSGLVNDVRTLTFQGNRLSGIFQDRAFLKHMTLNTTVPLEAVRATLLSTATGLMLWEGKVPARIAAGFWEVFVDSTCGSCGGPVKIGTGALNQWLAREPLAEVQSLIVSGAVQPTLATNDQDNFIRLQGAWLSSVNRVAISSSPTLLVQNIPSQTSLPITSVATNQVMVRLNAGFPSGEWWLGVNNDSGASLVPVQLSVREGPIESATVSIHSNSGLNTPIGGTPPQIFNNSSFFLRLDGERLSSLSEIRLIHQSRSGIQYTTAPFVKDFVFAGARIPLHMAPGFYRISVVNEGGVRELACQAPGCLEIRESGTTIQKIENVTAAAPLTFDSILSSESALIVVEGVGLAGIERARMVAASAQDLSVAGIPAASCAVQGIGPGVSPEVNVQPDYFVATLSVGPSQFLTPGCYVTEFFHTNLGWLHSSVTIFRVLERQPTISQLLPSQLGTNVLASADFEIRGSGLFGLTSADFYRMTSDVADCSMTLSTPTISIPRQSFVGFDSSSARLANGGLASYGVSPGTWILKVKNRSFPNVPGSSESPCDPNRAVLKITEPQLEFTGFPVGGGVLPSTVLGRTQTSPIQIAGAYLSGLREVNLIRRFDVTNIPSSFATEITSTVFSLASLRVPTGLLPGDYDLELTNSSGLGPIRTGLVTIIEDLPPLPEDLILASDDSLNTHDIFLQLYGEHMESLALQTSQISVPISARDLCLRDLRSEASALEATRCVSLSLSDVSLIALPDGTRYLELKVPAGFYGGDYELEIANMTGSRASPPVSSRLTVFEPVADFSTVSVLKLPNETEFGFGENDRLLKLEIRGDHLASVDSIRLELDDPFESGLENIIELDESIIHRVFDSTGVSLITTVERYRRPGSYNLRLRNNSGTYSPVPNPITSRFSQQVQVREGGPRLIRSGCLDMTEVCEASPSLSTDASCQPNSTGPSLETSRNVDSTRNLRLAGCNFFTLSRIRIYREDSLIPELSWEVPPLGASLEGSGVLTRATAAIEVDLPQFLKYIGSYDVQITNSASSRRFSRRLRSIETFRATINSVFPTLLQNTEETTLNVSGDHLTGTTHVALWSVDSNLNPVTEVVALPFVQNANDPLHFLTAEVPRGLSPGNYRLRIDNTIGFNPVPNTNILTVAEAPLSITTLSERYLLNDTTRVLTLTGDGFMGVVTSQVKLEPVTDAIFGPLNAATLVPLASVSIAGVEIVSRTQMKLTVPAKKLPGYYWISMGNTVSTSFRSALVPEIREVAPKIYDIDPASRSYALNTTMEVRGDAYLGVRGGSSDSYVRLKSVFGSIERTVDADVIDYHTLLVDVPQNLAIGEYEIEVKNTQGVANSRVVTRLSIIEELASVSLVSPATLAYDANFLSGVGVDFYGLNFQGVSGISMTTTVTAGTFTYDFQVPCPDLIPYIAMQSCRISTSGIVYPGVYDLSVTNMAGTTPLTQTLEILIPSSTISSFTQEGPLNSETEIILTGQNLRRFEILRMIATAGAETCDAISNADPNCSVKEISNTEARLLFNLPGATATSWTIEYQTYGDRRAGIGPRYLEFFTRTGNVPEITGFTYAAGGGLPTTSDFVGSTATVTTTHIERGLPANLIISGNHFLDIQRIELWKDSRKFTLACTTAFGVDSLNRSTDATLPVFLPSQLFSYGTTPPVLPIGGGVCTGVNTTGPTLDVMSLPLRPGVYSFVLVGRDNNKVMTSGKKAPSAQFYFGEDRPSQVSISILSPTTFNNQDLQYEVTGKDLGGADLVEISRSLAPTFLATYGIGASQISSLGKFTGIIPKGTVRGLKDPNFPYFFQVRNSRGKIVAATPIIKIGEEAAQLTTINPPSGRNNNPLTVTVSGLNLLGAGQITGGPPANPNRNQVRLTYKPGYMSADITTETVELSSSVYSQSVTSFLLTLPSQLRPGDWFLSVENDFASTVGNPLIATNVVFTVVDSAVQVLSLTPTTSAFDVLPATMTLTGQSLGGLHTLTLNLLDESLNFSRTLSLVSSPDVTSATWGAASFTLPQSPEFLIPGTYSITVENPTEAVTLPNLTLDILEKPPLITGFNASSYSNATTRNLDIYGRNLFGRPTITLARTGSTAISLGLTGITQSAGLLEGLTLPDSLYPDTWSLSLVNSAGSTQFPLVVTEPVPIVNQLIPSEVPFDLEAPIRIIGDHMLGVQTASSSVVLTDLIRTPLIGVLPLDRYEIAAVVPQGVNVGRYEVLVSNRTGRNTTSAFLTVKGSGLSVTSFAPVTGPRSGGNTVILSGTAFREGASVTFGGTAGYDVKVLPDSLEVVVPPAAGSLDFSSGQTMVDITVYHLDGEAVTAPGKFTYIAIDPGSPMVEYIVPGSLESGAGEPSGIPLNSRIAVKFNQSMDPSTLSTPLGVGPGAYYGFQVLSAGGAIGGTLAFNPDQDWFVFDTVGNNYVANDRVEIGLSSVLRGANGREFVTTDTIRQSSSFFERDSFIEDWSFVAGAAADTNSLGVSGVNWDPAPETPITVNFNKAVNPLTVFAEDFRLREVATERIIAVVPELSRDLQKVELNPVERRISGLDYELRVASTRLESLTQQKMSGPHFASISTAESGPQVISVIPAHGSTEILLNRTVIFEFNQPVDPTTVNTSTISLKPQTGEAVLAEIRNNAKKTIFTLRPQDFLEIGQDYVFEVNRGVKSLTGVFAAQTVTSGFRTIGTETVDTSAPVVASVRPLNGQSSVDIGTSIEISFSEPVHPGDLNEDNLKLMRSGSSVPISIQVSSGGQFVNLEPQANLEYGTSYDVFIAANLHDYADNTSDISVETSFSTTGSFDENRPSLISSTPSSGSLNISTGVTVVLNFSEPLDPAGVESTDFRFIAASGNVVPFSFSFNGTSIVSLMPSQALARGTTYRVEVLGGMTDLSANPVIPATVTFSTQIFIDLVPPEITLLTVNGLPHCLNGDNYNCSSQTSSILGTVAIEVPENRFTIDVYYQDPGLEGESSGILPDSVAVTNEKQIFNAATNSSIPANSNLLLQSGAVVEKTATHTRLYVPSSWQFQDGLNIIRASVRDASAQGNLSNAQDARAQYRFQVVSRSLSPETYGFENGPRLFALDFSRDRLQILPSVRGGALTIATTQEISGAPDWLEAMNTIGLVSYIQDRFDSPTPAQISDELKARFPQRVLAQVRALFGQDANGNVLDASREMQARFSLNVGDASATVISVGGDDGAEWGSTVDREGGVFFNPGNGQFVGVVTKASDNAPFNARNSQASLDLSACTPLAGTCSGVFDLHIIRRYANATTAIGEWRRVMAPFTPLAYSGVLNQTGFPIGKFPEDANVYLLQPSEVNSQTIPVEFHRERYFQMQEALDAWAKVLAVHIARVASNAVGAQPDGIPPYGIYGGNLGLTEYFRTEQAALHRHQPWIENQPANNVLKKDVSFEDVTSTVNPIGFSFYEDAWWAGRMRVR